MNTKFAFLQRSNYDRAEPTIGIEPTVTHSRGRQQSAVEVVHMLEEGTSPVVVVEFTE